MTPIDLTPTQEAMMQEKDDAELSIAVLNLYHPGRMDTADLMKMIEKRLEQEGPGDVAIVMEAITDWLGYDCYQIAAAARWVASNPDYFG